MTKHMNNNHIFLLGATGYIGQRIATQLVSSGYQVSALVRDPSKNKILLSEINIVPGDFQQPDHWIHHVDDKFGVINAAFPSHGSSWSDAVAQEQQIIELIANRLAGQDTKLILSNGTAFLGDSGERRLDEESNIKTNHPASVRASLIKHALQASGGKLSVIELRLASFVYGYSGSVFLPILLESAMETKKSIYVSDGNCYTSTVHVDAVARAYEQALHYGAAGEVYHIASDEEPSVKDIAQAVAVAVGNGCKSFSVEAEEALQYVDPFTAMFLSQNNLLDSRKARRELNWSGHAPTSLLWDVAYGSYATK